MTGFEIALIILASGYVAGGVYDRLKKATAERRKAKARALSGPEPVCGCGHHLAYHDARDALCYASVPASSAGADEAQRCPCRRYAGPEPLATLYAPELAAPVGEREAVESAD
ncbi:hypothetical protein [Streptomyces sp. NPDC059452]|uniref:hypothetical protein n=1 Tax=Streptomyces sp. NPDC059452 TaxID=3346835 RepID=UPI00367B63BD